MSKFLISEVPTLCHLRTAQKRNSGIPGEERAERVLANAISLDGREELTSKFCSESNVWTRWRCRRCHSNIPARMQGKYRQAVAAKSGEWSTGSSTSSGEEDRKTRSLEAENKELRARIDAMEKKEGVQGGPSITSKGGGDSEDVRGEFMDVEDEAESRKKLDERKRKLQKELRDVDRLSSCFQGNAGEHQGVTAAPVARGGDKEA